MGELRTRALCNFPLTCRQIHAEAAGLIFKLNRFVFFSLKALEDFVSQLSPAQKDAITEIGFWTAFVVQDWETQVIHVDPKFLDIPRVCIGLGGLKRIHLRAPFDENVAEVREAINDLRHALGEQKGRANSVDVVYEYFSD